MRPNPRHDLSRSLHGIPLDLTRLLDYHKGSVVSREIVRNDAGTLTVFAFDRGQGLSEHTAPFDAVVYLLDGEAMIVIAGKTRRIKKHRMIIMPAGKPHSLKAITKFKMLLILIKKKAVIKK